MAANERENLETPQTAPYANEAPPPHDSSAATLPEFIGRYRIVELVGQGGMGKVYKAHDTVLDRMVAVKVPRVDRSADDWENWKTRFMREARVAAQVRHPHICPLYDVAEHDGTPFVVMAYVEGRSLARHLAKEPGCLESRRAIALVLQVADALGAVHDHGMIHRDLKPGNILLDREGNAVLTDFGLARFLDEGDRLTQTGVGVGTPGYMAPEQAAGQSEKMGPWTDLYSLGALLVRVLTSRLSPTGVLPAELEPGLRRIIEKAMAAAPEDRFVSAAQMRQALEEWLRHQDDGKTPRQLAKVEMAGTFQESASSKTPLLQAVLPGRHVHRLALLAAATLLAALLVWMLFALNREPVSNPLKKGTEDSNPPPPNKKTLAGPLVIDAQPWQLTPRQPLSSLALVQRPAVIAGLDSWTLETKIHRGPVFALARSPHKEYLAAAGNDGAIRLWDADGKKLLRILIGHDAAVRCLSWSPAGDYLAAGDDQGAIRLWETATGRLMRTISAHKGAVRGLSWSPVGVILASGGDDKVVRFWIVRTGQAEDYNLVLNWAPRCMQWSPDGSMLALAGNHKDIHLWEASSRKLLPSLPGHRLPLIHDLAWSPDGSTLVSAAQDGIVGWWTIEEKNPGRMQVVGLPATALAWSEQGDRVAVGTAMGIEIRGKQGAFLETRKKPTGAIHALAWKDNLVAAFYDGKLSFWNGDEPAQSIVGHPNGAAAIDWSADGKYLAVAGQSDRILRLWNAVNEKVLPSPAGFWEAVLAWLPDSVTLAKPGPGYSIDLVDATTGATVESFTGHTADILALAPSRDGKMLASVSADGSVRVWQRGMQKPLWALDGLQFDLFSIAWSPRGDALALGGMGKVRVWLPEKQKTETVIENVQGSVQALAWAPDGQRIAAGDGLGDGMIHIHRPDGKKVQSFRAHENGVWALRFSPDGKVLASGGIGEVRFWDGETVKPLGVLKGSPGLVRSLCWRADSKTLASSWADGSVRLAAPGAALSHARLIPLVNRKGLLFNVEGHYQADFDIEAGCVYVTRTADGQMIYGPKSFSEQFGWQNFPPNGNPP